MIRIAIAEDNQIDCQQIIEKLHTYEKEYNTPVDITHFSNGMDLVTNYKPIYDLLILDIEMPLLDGISTAKRVRETDRTVQILFLTNMAQFALNGYEVEAIGYVLKPISYYSLVVEMKKVSRILCSQIKRTILLTSINETKRISVDEITYVEINNHQLVFHTMSGSSTLTGSLKAAEQELSQNGFASCNRCYLVNMRYVEKVQNFTVVVAGTPLAISRNKRKNFLSALNSYYGGWV